MKGGLVMVEKIGGVSVEVSFDGTQMVPLANSFVGCVTPAFGKVVLCVKVASERGGFIYALTVDQKKNVVKKKNLASGLFCVAHYRAIVPIRMSSGGSYCAEEAHNCIRLLEFYGNTGFRTNGLRVWEVAIVSQNGEFFLTVQKEYEADLWQESSGGNLFITEEKLMNWPQMRVAIGELFPKAWAPLPLQPGIGFKADPFAGETPSRGVARVKWYSPRSGLGALRTMEGDARVDWTQVSPRDGFSYLVAGELVSYPHPGWPFRDARRTK